MARKDSTKDSTKTLPARPLDSEFRSHFLSELPDNDLSEIGRLIDREKVQRTVNEVLPSEPTRRGNRNSKGSPSLN